MTQKKRGRETAVDMVRTLLVVMALVVPLWYFGQGAPGDKKHIRPVPTSQAYADFVSEFHGPVLSSTPKGWVANVVDTDTVVGVLRVGYVLDHDYLEFAGGQGTDFLVGEMGHTTLVGPVAVGSTSWQDYKTADGHESLVRTSRGVTVVIGGVRETASHAQLVQFAALVR